MFLTGKADFNISDRKIRQRAYYFAIISYLAGAVIFSYFGNKMLCSISFCYATVTFSLAAINLRWKISAHTAGVTGPLTALTYVFGSAVLPFHLLVLPVMWLRVKMKAHTFAQVIAGSVAAAIVTFITYLTIW
jgi:membrane-associated phospholipid phosphatase